MYKHRKSRKVLPAKIWLRKQALKIGLFLCRYDARNEAINASIWSEDAPRGFGARAQFDPRDISLRIDNIQAHESGLYRCRLDFKRSQTRNVLVNLTVIGKQNCVSTNFKGKHYITSSYSTTRSTTHSGP